MADKHEEILTILGHKGNAIFWQYWDLNPGPSTT
jgi:hypothetical protein